MPELRLTPKYPIDDLTELGVQAEREGYDSCFVSCHYNNRDPFAVLARSAAETDNVRLGPSVVNPYELHPMTLVGRVVTVVEAPGDYGLLDIGLSDPLMLHNLNLEDERGFRSVLETFKVAQKLRDGEHINRSSMFEATDTDLNLDMPDEVPVYIGGEDPHMCRMTGKHVDGLLFNGSYPDDLVWVCEQVDISVEGCPGPRGEFTSATYASVPVSGDADTAREVARPPVTFIAAGAVSPVFDRHGIDTGHASDIGEKISIGNFSEAFGLIMPAVIGAFSIAGTPDDVTNRMNTVLEHADDVMVRSPAGPDLEETIVLVAAAYHSTNQHR